MIGHNTYQNTTLLLSIQSLLDFFNVTVNAVAVSQESFTIHPEQLILAQNSNSDPKTPTANSQSKTPVTDPFVTKHHYLTATIKSIDVLGYSL